MCRVLYQNKVEKCCILLALSWEYSNMFPLEWRPKTSVTDFRLLEIWRHTVWCKDSIISENPVAVFVTSVPQPWTYPQHIHSKCWSFSTRKCGVTRDSNNNRNYLTSLDETHCSRPTLTFWTRNYFFLVLAHPVYKMRIIQGPNTIELWNKLHFEEEKTESIHHV